MEGTEGRRRYWAFISYSHKDRRWARWLHRALESYSLPSRLVGISTPGGPAPRRLRPVFKDREDLPADTDLRGRVNDALADSSCLIVICSPDAARSAWVRDEILRFKSMHGESRVFAAIVAGTPKARLADGRADDECFPQPLQFRVDAAGSLTSEPAEIIAADLRKHGDGRRLALLKIIAGMLGVDLDDLARRDAQRRAQRLAGVALGSVTLSIVMAALTLVAIGFADDARRQRDHAEGLVEFMLSDLNKRLRPVGRLDILDAVGRRAMAYYDSQGQTRLAPDDLGRRARVLHLLGDADSEVMPATIPI